MDHSLDHPSDHPAPAATPLLTHPDLFHAIWQHAADAMVLSDAAGIVLAANPAYFRLYGYGADAVVGHSFAIIFPPAQRAWAVAQYQRVFASAIAGPAYEAVIQRADGTERVVESRIDFLRTNDQRVAMLSTIRDITERTQADEQLRQAAAADAFRVRLADAVRPLADPVAIQDAAVRVLGQHLQASRVHYGAITADHAHVVVERAYTDGVPQLHGRFRLADFGPPLITVLRAGTTLVMDDLAASAALTAAERAAFGAIEVGAHVVVPLVKGGHLAAVLAVHQATPRGWTAAEVALIEETAERTWAAVERARADATLRASEARYRTVFTSIDAGFCVVEVLFDDHGAPVDYRFVELNPAFVHHTGLADALGKRMRELRPTHEAFWFEAYGRVARTGEAVRFEQRAAALDRWYDVYAFRVGQPDEHRVAIVFNDITARKQAEAAVAQALAAAQAARAEAEAALTTREQFLSIAAHELRTPLTALLGYAQLLPSAVRQGRGNVENMMTHLTQQAQRLNSLVNQLLDVTRLQRGPFALDRQVLDLAALVAQVVAAFETLAAAAAQHQVELQRPDGPVWVLGDGPRLEQVLTNLLSNALKYSPAGGVVAVHVAVAEGWALVDVTDQGIGIPQAAHARLFEPFYRASNVGAGTSGFGLGLYVVHEIVRRHDGRVEVASAESQGTTVRLRLPLADRPG